MFLALLCVLCLTLLPSGRAQTPPASTPRATHILFLTADGFRTDYIEWYNPPHLKQLIAEGVRVLHVTNVFPTVTAPNMCSLVTGAYPRTTTIAGNSE
jgi:predicted AlkP superfamily pyrophosphatase or phosphodiesterase